MNKNPIYIVLRKGVYFQGCLGIYTTEKKAKNAAQRALALAPDDYHNYYIYIYIYKTTLDIKSTIEYPGEITEKEPIAMMYTPERKKCL